MRILTLPTIVAFLKENFFFCDGPKSSKNHGPEMHCESFGNKSVMGTYYIEFWTFSVENYTESRVQFLLPISYVPQIEFGIDAMVYRITCRVGLIC